ncbi:hypothetical protein KIW84_072949 [Lathyrus oleraceus]|uniref:Uncharacterized protein n=1 Tax=Pisum sativum TaxID=3888 RepID=A0A9D4VMB7_PEA|nr:hypothetical protein KIW84_072949 [Pisum sativum]
MMMNPILDIDKALSLVIKQEREMNSVVSTIIPSIRNNEEIITLSAQASHDAQHGKPNKYRGKYQGANGPRGFTNKSKNNGSGSQHTATINSALEVSAIGSITSSYGFTQEKYNNIISLLRQSKLPSIASSVSTSPLVMNYLSSNVNVPIFVTLPDEPQLSASISGTNPSKETIGITELQNGLYVLDTTDPHYTYNDLSVVPSACNLNDTAHALSQSLISFDNSIVPSPTSVSIFPEHNLSLSNSPTMNIMRHNTSLSKIPDHAIIIPDTSSPSNPPSRQSMRTSHPPSYLPDYQCYSTSSTSLQSKGLYPLSFVLSYSQCYAAYQHFCCSISSNTKPFTFHQANKLDCLKHAMTVKLQALADNHTWNVVDLPPGLQASEILIWIKAS